MKKIVVIWICLILSLWGISSANDLISSHQENLDKVVEALSQNIFDNWIKYKNQSLKSLNEIKANLSWDERSVLIDYVIEKISLINVRYAIAIHPTPLFNTGDIHGVLYGTWKGPLLDKDDAQIYELEDIAFTGTAFTVKWEFSSGENTFYIVNTKEYPYPTTPWYYVDARFLRLYKYQPLERKIVLPSKKDIIATLTGYVWYGYVWGGNIPGWVPLLKDFYAPSEDIDQLTQDKLILSGFDCSGILYAATNWFTPRNTSKLVKFWTWLAISGLNIDEISSQLKPLDIIGWRGHVMIVIDEENLIESRLDYDPVMTWAQESWVKIRNIKTVLTQIMQERLPVNDYDDVVPEWQKKFVIRRWQ